MVEKSQFLVMFNFFPWKKKHFRQKSPKMQNFATSWGHRAAKMNPMNIIFSSKLNSNVFLHPQKILGPIDFHRSLHNFFAEKKHFRQCPGHVRKSSELKNYVKNLRFEFFTFSYSSKDVAAPSFAISCVTLPIPLVTFLVSIDTFWAVIDKK